MKINNNIPALNANRILGRNTMRLGDTLERLSSGKRINRASDDAAGLAISQKMKAQILGLQQASRNSLDGISMIQTGEGALDEVHEMLKRMRELTVQGANGVYGTDDLDAILEEVNQLTDQIEKVAERTDFNGVKMLMGHREEVDMTKLEGVEDSLIYKNEMEEKNISDNEYKIKDIEKKLRNNNLTNEDRTKLIDEENNLKEANKNSKEMIDKNKEKIEQARKDLDQKNGEIEKFNLDIDKEEKVLTESMKTIDTKEKELDIIRKDILEKTKRKEKTENIEMKNKLEKEIEELETEKKEKIKELETEKTKKIKELEKIENLEAEKKEKIKELEKIEKESGLNLENARKTLSTMYLQVGANEDDNLVIDLKDFKISKNELGKKYDKQGKIIDEGLSLQQQVEQLKDIVDKNENKLTPKEIENTFSIAIGTYDNAVARVSSIRAKMGAVQNRLESTIRTLDNTTENLTGAMSRIEDIDMAGEMSEFTKFQVLQQSSTAMLGEANKLPQTVLQLLQG